MKGIRIKGVGIYAPGKAIDNCELKKLAHIDFDSEKIENKLGIKKRHIARLRGISVSTADFAERSTRSAIHDAGLEPADIDLFIVATDTPEYISPGTAVLVQGRIQGKEMNTMAFDINASCAGFVTAFDVGARILSSNSSMCNAVITGVYNMPAFLRDDDVFGFTIFADGAGSIVLQKNTNSNSEYISGNFITDGTQWDYIGIYSGGARKQVTHEVLERGEYGLQSLKPLPGNRNTKLWPPLVHSLLGRGSVDIANLDHIIFTQINKTVISEVMNILDLPMEKTTTVMDKYGYTGSACVPMAFYHAVKEKHVKPGDTIMFVASGAGLSVGSNLFRY